MSRCIRRWIAVRAMPASISSGDHLADSHFDIASVARYVRLSPSPVIASARQQLALAY